MLRERYTPMNLFDIVPIFSKVTGHHELMTLLA